MERDEFGAVGEIVKDACNSGFSESVIFRIEDDDGRGISGQLCVPIMNEPIPHTSQHARIMNLDAARLVMDDTCNDDLFSVSDVIDYLDIESAFAQICQKDRENSS